MYTLAIVNQKGGVGKTTTAVTLAHGLARRGRRVLLVDLDPQGNVADCLGMEKGSGVYDLLVGEGTGPVMRDRRLEVVNGGKPTAVARQILVGEMYREGALARALRGWCEAYDVCVLDSAPSLDLLQVCALVAADGFLIPVRLDPLAVGGAVETLESVGTLRQFEATYTRFLGILPTFWDRVTTESDHQLRWLVEQYGELVWPPVPLDTRVREAPAHGQTLWEYAHGSRAVEGVLLNGQRHGGYVQVVLRLLREMNGDAWGRVAEGG